ncbi:hypothetical protein ACJMK2_007683 [Sinanodonta woodiana]|uniref:Uncharacterized protein n=1 Tax=Sinanodonta woodiana TaxID=1069815 RepID=A0ABD3VM76_SINWO
MKNKLMYFALIVSACFQKATTDAETVWLKDVTTRIQTDKREVNGADLPDQLTFHLKRRNQDLVLNLKRNYHIDPNADIYIVQTLNDGRTILEKSQNLETKVSVQKSLCRLNTS